MTAESVTTTPTSTMLNSQRNIRPKPTAVAPTAPQQPPKPLAPATSKPLVAPAPTTSSAVTKPTSALKAIWYLGGNHVVKLLTSVDGDLDPSVLGKLEAVPSVVGELALSVESLVSDDITVGGFESDLLAKIASNTLISKPRPAAPAPAAPVSPVTKSAAQLAPKVVPMVHVQHKPQQQHIDPKLVPNPLAAQNPVPNPLARITPPGSPSSHHSSETSKKRKAPTTLKAAKTSPVKKTKLSPRPSKSSVQAPLIQAR